MDPFDRNRLYSLLAKRWTLEAFIKEQSQLVEFITTHIKKPGDAVTFVEFIKSLDLNESDYNYAINLVSSALSIKIEAAENLKRQQGE